MNNKKGHDNVYRISRFLHWFCAVFFVVLIISMPIMLDIVINSAEREKVYITHQSVATFFFLLLTCRFIWIFITKTSGTKINFQYKWQFFFAKLNHILLYLLMIAMPVTGLLSRMSAGKAIVIFNFQLFPSLDFMVNRDIKFYTNEAHILLVDVFYIFIVLHVLGALSHLWHARRKSQ